MMSALRPASCAAGVSLGRTSAYTPSSRTLRAMRWQYCPPASRTVTCGWGCKLIRAPALLPRGGHLAAHALDDDLLGGIQQGLGLGHGVDGPLHLRVGFHIHLLRFVQVESRDVHFALKVALDPVGVLGELRLGELHVLLQQEVVKIV